jgi:hypothetical protein
MSVGSLLLVTSPVNVISPLFTVAVTPGKSFVASVIPDRKESSALITTGAGAGSGVVTVVFSFVVSFGLLLHEVTETPVDSNRPITRTFNFVRFIFVYLDFNNWIVLV